VLFRSNKISPKGAPAPGTGATIRLAELGELMTMGAWLQVHSGSKAKQVNVCTQSVHLQMHSCPSNSESAQCVAYPPHVGHQHQEGVDRGLHAVPVRLLPAGTTCSTTTASVYHVSIAAGLGAGRQAAQQLQTAAKLLQEGAHAARGLRGQRIE